MLCNSNFFLCMLC